MGAIKGYTIKAFMFISSYFPLYFMLLILHYEKYREITKINDFKIFFFLVMILCAILVSVVSLIFLTRSDGNKRLLICEIERPDDTIISYMMTYIIPILTTNLANRSELIVNLILFSLIGYLYIRLNLLYLNPLWSIFGYLSYRVNSDVIIITNIKFVDLKYMKNNRMQLKGFYIANDIFVAQKKSNSV